MSHERFKGKDRHEWWVNTGYVKRSGKWIGQSERPGRSDLWVWFPSDTEILIESIWLYNRKKKAYIYTILSPKNLFLVIVCLECITLLFFSAYHVLHVYFHLLFILSIKRISFSICLFFRHVCVVFSYCTTTFDSIRVCSYIYFLC